MVTSTTRGSAELPGNKVCFGRRAEQVRQQIRMAQSIPCVFHGMNRVIVLAQLTSEEEQREFARNNIGKHGLTGLGISKIQLRPPS